jgi:hypothetical protein
MYDYKLNSLKEYVENKEKKKKNNENWLNTIGYLLNQNSYNIWWNKQNILAI